MVAARAMKVNRRTQVVVVLDAKHSDVAYAGAKPAVRFGQLLDSEDTPDGINTVVSEVDAALLSGEAVLAEHAPDIAVGVLPGRCVIGGLKCGHVHVERDGVHARSSLRFRVVSDPSHGFQPHSLFRPVGPTPHPGASVYPRLQFDSTAETRG